LLQTHAGGQSPASFGPSRAAEPGGYLGDIRMPAEEGGVAVGSFCLNECHA